MDEDVVPTLSGNRWEPPAVPAWHPEQGTAAPSRTATSELPQVGGATADGVPAAQGKQPRRALSARLRRRPAPGAAAVALLAIGGVGGFAVG
ncbi:hypothetical protein SAMN05660657_04812 [Geodermatophilus amargosae]|uniref:Uncharacterized protein n=1 Tax=Geodermatophilus amargosae TaxID=1296565 RepID=A0A1I7CRL0_9ACTN|nr:hypothetical protein [Geodermatophilus amargosae]SFU02107.1 hypothetical protein SAMN05660657_04812 [Geodermatophilus amargosae]